MFVSLFFVMQVDAALPMRVYTATLTLPCMSMRWLLENGAKFPVGMTTSIDGCAQACGVKDRTCILL